MAATSTATFMVCDLVGSAARHARIGEDAADQFRARFFEAMRTAVAANRGEVIKNLGDGLLVVFRSSTVDALQCAHDLHAAVQPLDGDDPVQLRVGVSAGEAAEEDGDWFGMPVIEASRLCAAAAPATTVTSGIVRALAGSRGSHHFTALGAKELKGIPEPVELWQVHREPPAASALTPIASAPSRRRFVLPAIAAVFATIALVWAATTAGDDDSTAVDSTIGSGQTNVPQPTDTAAADTIAAATSAPAAAPTTSPTSVPATVTAPIGYTPVLTDRDCATDPLVDGIVGIECWSLTVPENRARPGRTIELRGYRIPATSNTGAAPTIIDLGPTTSFADAMSAANTVVVPSRGFGLSTPGFDCAEVDQVIADGLALPSNDEGVAAAAIDAVRACRDRLIGAGFDLASYNAEAEIGDVTDYLVAAGVDHAFITATPNDAPAALLAADRFPGTFQGVFLQNPVDPGSSWRADPVKDTAAAFSRYVALCQADPGCAAAYPTLEGAVADAFERIGADPRTFDVTATVIHQRRYPQVQPRDVRVYFDGDRFAETVPSSLQVSIIYPLLAKSLVDGTDAGLPAAAGLAAVSELGRFGANTAAFLSYQCAVLPRTASTAPTSAVLLPEFAAAYDEHFLDWCEVWDVPSLSAGFTSPSQGRTPTFIAVGALSPTPVALYAENLLRYRSNTTVITFATMGSAIDLLGPPCYRDLLLAFVSDPSAELATDECAAQSPPIAFVL